MRDLSGLVVVITFKCIICERRQARRTKSTKTTKTTTALNASFGIGSLARRAHRRSCTHLIDIATRVQGRSLTNAERAWYKTFYSAGNTAARGSTATENFVRRRARATSGPPAGGPEVKLCGLPSALSESQSANSHFHW